MILLFGPEFPIGLMKVEYDVCPLTVVCPLGERGRAHIVPVNCLEILVIPDGCEKGDPFKRQFHCVSKNFSGKNGGRLPIAVIGKVCPRFSLARNQF